MIGTRRTVPLPVVLLLLLAAGAARAEVRVGVVDSQRIVFESEAGKLARSTPHDDGQQPPDLRTAAARASSA